jgi:hypothetical protein
MKITGYFDRRDFERLLRELQPVIEGRKTEVYKASPADLRSLFDKRQCYWIIQLRYSVHTSTWVGGGHGGTVHSNSINLVSVEISDSPTGREGALKHGETVVAPARHAVVLMEDSRIVTYSEPIVSWHHEFAGLEGGRIPSFGREARGQAAADPLLLASTHELVTEARLLSWAREHYRLGLSALVKNIYNSNEFIGSENARENAADLLRLRWQKGGPPP